MMELVDSKLTPLYWEWKMVCYYFEFEVLKVVLDFAAELEVALEKRFVVVLQSELADADDGVVLVAEIVARGSEVLELEVLELELVLALDLHLLHHYPS